MCYDEGTLMSHLDGEGSAEKRAEIAAHLAACPECATSAEQLAADREFASRVLDELEPAAEIVPLPVGTASPAARVAGHASVASRPDLPRVSAGRTWRIAAGIAAAALIFGSFGLAPVRHAAASLLQVFRVQKVQTVTISEADLQNIETSLADGKGHVNLESFGDVWIDGGGAEAKTVTASAAQSALDFPVRLPKSQASKPTLTLTAAQTYRFKLHVAAINEALQSYGSDRLLPAALDGKEFSVKIPAILVAEYPAPVGVTNLPNGPADVYVGQARSPELVVPDGVDPSQLRDVLVNLPFLPQSVRDQLASVNDWQSTLLIPNIDGTAHDVTINGVPAVVISPKSAVRDARAKLGPLPDSTAVIWNDNGVVRGVGGPISETAAIDLAKSTMP
jgi:hypothetical protein